MKVVSQFSQKNLTILLVLGFTQYHRKLSRDGTSAPEHEPEPESTPKEKPGLDPFAPEWPADRPEPRPKA